MLESLRAKIAAAAADNPQFGPGSFPAVTPGLVLHLDGDYMAYYCAGNDDCEPGRARRNALDRIEQTRRLTGSESVVVHLSHAACTKAHRYVIATVKAYQGQRTGRKPKNWAYLRDVLEHYEGPIFKPKLWMTREADDGIAYCANQARVAISTRDKDMRMLPGLHINWMTYELTEVKPGEFSVIGSDGLQYGRKWFYLQLLQGDTADNIPGLPKLFGKQCGEATAGTYLRTAQDGESAYDFVQTAYADFYGSGWADALVEQAALLWLRTDAQASIANVAEGFPDCPHIKRALERLEARVTQELNAISQNQAV
ncbi:phosphodiesterase [Burkholderia vietnamiensis]|uniref:phosphodiesterase n=1 Tax=Burkholderia vietnamiensis TaxID=60552 RepID=UPI000A72282C|nr:phosphodiesterase [Burkholderia vietnamiensis]